MFNAMMDPEIMRLAQEQMSKMPPAELAKIQQQVVFSFFSSRFFFSELRMVLCSYCDRVPYLSLDGFFLCKMNGISWDFTKGVFKFEFSRILVLAIVMFSNPELMKLATESMKNMRPDDVRLAAEQLKHAKNKDITDLTDKIANASPEELASLRTRAEAQISYQISAAEMLKKQGNGLHASMQYHEAANKYLRAKDNLQGIPSAKSSTLKLQCSLNLMSCYLKTMQYEDCVKEGSEVLKNDSKNVKALYRRGQAYKELGKLEAAVSDLSMAHKFSPEDETIADVLRDAKAMLMKNGSVSTSLGVVIEEIDEEETRTVPSNSHSTVEYSVTQPVEGSESNQNGGCYDEVSTANPEALRTFNEDTETIRLFQKYVSNADTESLSAMGLGGMSPEIIRTATEMISSMKAEELQKMFEVASSLKGNGSPFSNMNGHGMNPELIRMASDKISSMPPEELKKMYEFSSSFNASSMKAASDFSTQRSESSSQSSVSAVNTTAGTRSTSGQSSSTTLSEPPSDLQDTMRNSMKDPAMRQMFTSMMKNMSPEMMTNMSEQFGMKLSEEDAAKAQQAMASLSPEDLDRMMRWAERAQKVFEIAKKTKHWFLGRPGMLLAIVMLILAFILHQLGYIGS